MGDPVAELLTIPVPGRHLVSLRRVGRFVNDHGRAVLIKKENIVSA